MTTAVGTSVESRRPAEARRQESGLTLQRCIDCGAYPNYPRVRCPKCFGQLEWTNSAGNGTLVSRAVVRRPHDARYEPFVPIVMGHISLDEGVEVISTIVGDNRLQARLGDRVTYARQGHWSVLPQFELARAAR